MKARHALAVVESAYDLALSGDAWLRQVAEWLAEGLEGTVATFGLTVSMSDEGRPVFHEAHFPGVDDPVRFVTELHRPMNEVQVESFYRPGTFSGTFTEYMAALEEHGPLDEAHSVAAEIGAWRSRPSRPGRT